MESLSPRLETERLILRGWRESDLDGVAAMMADADVARFITLDGMPLDRAAAWRQMALFVGHWALKGYGLFAVEEKETGAFVGRVGPWNPEGWPGIEIGWGIAKPFWGRGLAAEAAYAAGAWAFETLGLDHVISLIDDDNVRSQTLAWRLGERGWTPTLLVGRAHTIWRAERSEWRCARKAV